MPEHVILIDRAGHWKPREDRYPVVTAAEYLTSSTWQKKKNLRVVNLCKTRRYLGQGYYCSLLAEARGHRVIPSVRTISDLSRKSLYSLDTEDLGKRVQRMLGKRHKDIDAKSIDVTIMFGRSPLPELQGFVRELFEQLRVPLMRVRFRCGKAWRIADIKALGIQELADDLEDEFDIALDGYLSKRWRAPRRQRQARYDLAILHDPTDRLPPTDARGLKRFVRAARRFDMDAELITARDFGRLGEFDALFIRETTAIDHHTYRFSRKATSEGLVAIDDPDSILRCTNKIYLAELLKTNRIPTPRTVIARSDDLHELEDRIPYPIVLKVPDGSFSRGVFQVRNREELEAAARRLFKQSELLMGQAFTYTPFDWRVGIIDREPLYVCQYFMSEGHWQIYDHERQGAEGEYRTFAVNDVPPEVIDTALKAANLVGDGFYGVDLKQTDAGVMVIEINDNPSIESDVEDLVLGDALYDRIMQVFLTRIEKRGSARTATVANSERPGDVGTAP